MNKMTLKSLLKEELEGKTVKQKLAIINKAQATMKSVLKELENETKKGQVYCNQCKNWHPLSSYVEEKKVEVFEELTYTDAGYGDDDKYGEVEYYVTYQICPKNHRQIKNKSYIRTIREWGRYNWKK